MKKLIALSLLILIAFAGCKKDKGDPPVLPPAESMIIDFSNFESAGKSADVKSVKGTEDSSWEFSVVTVAVWRAIIGVTLIVPVTSFQMVIDQNPEYVSEKTWQWKHSATIAGATYQARLTGQIGANDVIWKMYITKDGAGAYTDFLWFEGTSAFDGKSGTWKLYESNANPVALVDIDWEKPAENEGKIRYTYVKNTEFKSSYIESGLTTSTLNRYFTIHYWQGAKFSDVFMEWNSTVRNGRVKSIDYLGDDLWHCWDANKINVICP